MKKLIFTLIAFVPMFLIAQETCNTPKHDALEDLNSITKCSVESKKEGNKKSSKQITVNVSASKKRYLKKRPALKKRAKNFLNTLSNDQVRKCVKFSDVDLVPAFSKCGTAKGDVRSNCFNTQMMKHIEKHLQYPNDAVVKKIEGKVWVRFVIDKNGDVTNVMARVSKGKEMLKEEALRVISFLPKFIPAKQNGKKVPVKFGFPINFSLAD